MNCDCAPFDHWNVFMIVGGLALVLSSLIWAVAWTTVNTYEKE